MHSNQLAQTTQYSYLANSTAEEKLRGQFRPSLDAAINEDGSRGNLDANGKAKNTRPSDSATGGLCVLGNQNGYLVA